MADYTFNGHALVSGDADFSARLLDVGRLTSDAEASISVGDTGPLSILGVSRVGTVVSVGREAGFVRVRVVGGRGKYDAEIESCPTAGTTLAHRAGLHSGRGRGGGWLVVSNVSCVDWTRAKGPLRDAMRRLGCLMGRAKVACDPRRLDRVPVGVVARQQRRRGPRWLHLPQEQVVQFFPAEDRSNRGQTIRASASLVA